MPLISWCLLPSPAVRPPATEKVTKRAVHDIGRSPHRWASAIPKALAAAKRIGLRVTVAADGTRTYSGGVTNQTSGTIYGLQVVTTLYDSKGVVLNSALGSAATLPLAVGATSGVSAKLQASTTQTSRL